jgi:hypothetical protein
MFPRAAIPGAGFGLRPSGWIRGPAACLLFFPFLL